MDSRKFSDEFKAEAVRAFIESSRTVVDVAKEYGIGSETLRNWVNMCRREHAGDEPELSDGVPHAGTRIRDMSRYIESRYNQKRLHSALEYRTPNEVENSWHETNKAAQ